MSPPLQGKLTVRRVGGMLPTMRPSKTHDLSSLDAATQAALTQFMATTGRVEAAPHAGAMNYVFELDSEAGGGKVSAGFAGVPVVLRGLLPGPMDR